MNKKITSFLLSLILLIETVPVYALTKDETVYSKLNADGSVNNTIVSEHLKNDGKETINDLTNLKNILNINGDEKFHLEDNKLTWQANGNDIYYQGETTENLPINQKITYELNGKEILIDDLLGKKGHVKINIKYTNTDMHLNNINGNYINLYTPFVVTLGTIIPLDDNNNIKVTNGKVISNGKNDIVIAIASPGLYESLDLDELKNFDTISIEYDTENFKLNSIYSVVSSKLISEEDLKIFNKLNNIYSKVNLLNDSSKQLVSGSEQLLNGVKSLKDGISNLNDGTKKAYQGSIQITNAVNDSIEALKNDNSEVLDQNSLNYISLKTEEEALKIYQSQENMISEAASISVKESTEYNEILTKYEEAIKNVNQTTIVANSYKEKMNLIDDKTSTEYLNLKSEYDKYYALSEQLNMASTMYQTMMILMEETAKKTAKETAKTVTTTLSSTISSKVATQVAKSAKEIFVNKTVQSLTVLEQSLKELSSGLKDLSDGTSTLYDGTSTLESGIQTLNTGLSKFDKEGIEEISNLVNGNVKNIEQRLKALVKLGNNYNTFTMKSSSDEGETKFVLVVDAQKKVEKEKNVINKTDEHKSLWQKIKNIFKK